MPEHVIVLHGLGLNKYWMWGLARSLRQQGYIVHNISYPSRHSFKNIIDKTLAPLIQSIPAEKINFIGHSMGGLLVRGYAAQYGASRIGRVVMLGTPNHGSEVADYLSRWRIFHLIFGQPLKELVTGAAGIAARLGPVSFECGVIAGSNHWFHFPSILLVKKMPKPNDGLVSVASTKVAGMKDHIVLWSDHSLMVWHKKVWRHAADFLKHGAF